MNTARKLDKHLIMATTKPQERARLICTVINLPVGVNSVASRKENGYMSETSKRELVIACAAALMLILFFGTGTL